MSDDIKTTSNLMYDNISDYIRNFIIDHDLSVKDVARLSGISEATIYRFISHKNYVTFYVICRICSALGLTIYVK